MSKKISSMFLTAILAVVSMSAYALDKVNGAYQIGTAEDLKAFAELVNGGERSANAILTADIDKGADILKIGVGGDYQGFFDGAGHTITINLTDGEDGEGPALFRGVGNRGIVQNLKVQGTITTGKYKHTAAIANYSGGIIRSCFVDVTVNANFADNADASIGGVAGQLNKCALIDNCLSKIKILGSTTHKCGGLAAWVDAQRVNIVNCLVINDKESNFNWSDGKSAGLVRDGDGLRKVVDLSTYNADSYKNRPEGANANNYVTNDWGVLSIGTAVVTPEEVASGKVCYQLNSDQSHIGWVQNIGDPYPVPAVFGKDKGQVYASTATDCQGKATGDVTFSNTPGNAAVTKHTYDKYGVCTTCGQFNWNSFNFDDPTRFEPATKSVLLGSAEDLFLAEGWNRLQNGFKLNMKMVNDIECTPAEGQLIFNGNDWVDSDFNGDGHTITINLVDIKENGAALFPFFDGNFENVIMHGSISTANSWAGSVAGRFYGNGQKVRNVFSDITINTTKTGDNTSGGLIGIPYTNTSIENCIYAGDINGVEGTEAIAGLVGWANGGTNYITNCAFLGTMTNAGGDSHTITRNYGIAACNNVYTINEYGNGADAGKYIKYLNPNGVASGELVYIMNDKAEGVERFYQKIGVDNYPLPVAKEGTLVYIDKFKCDGTPWTYANTPRLSDPVIPDHQFDADGICTVCGELEKDADGYMKIGNARALVQFSKLISNGKTTIKARLYDDIDMSNIEYEPAGNWSYVYTGEFDGQFHTISNLFIDNDKNYQGMFGVIGDSAVIKNFVLDETCSIKGNAFVGIIGGTNGSGSVYISNIGNEGIVTSINQNAAGIVGVDYSGATDMFISNCYVTGQINGGRESGAICGYSSPNSQVTNCWSTATMPQSAIYSSDSFTRGQAFVTNCYEAELDGVDANKQQHNKPMQEKSRTILLDSEELNNGILCFKLNGNQFRNPVWYQTLGEDDIPTPDPSHGVVLYAAETVYNVSEETVSDIKDAVASYYNGMYEDSIAYTVAVEDFNAKVEALGGVTTVIELADALDSLYAAETVVQTSVAVYKKYQDKCEEIQTYIKNHNDFAGPARDELEAYLEENFVDIIDQHELIDSLIEKEIVYVDELFNKALQDGYVAGSDVTSLFANTDFHNDVTDGWSSSMNKYANSRSTVTINKKPYYGCEAWNTKFDMHQTVKGLKPGYYLVSVQGAFRPSNDRYSYNYAAQVYANDNVNYLQSVLEGYISVDQAVDQENVYLTQFGGGDATFDWPIYEDGVSTEGENGLKGYVLHGPSGVAVAGYAGRCQNYVIAKAEGDSLTIGITNPGTNYGSDWTGFTSFKVVYAGEGDEAETYIDKALESMVARANIIIEEYRSEKALLQIKDEGQAPSYPAALKEALQAAVAAADAAQGAEAKMKAAETLSQLFKEFYEARQAYLAFYKTIPVIEAIDAWNLPLVEKDENGEWVEKDEYVFGDNLFDVVEMLADAYAKGSFSLEEAKNAAVSNIPEISDIVPLKDEDGYYLITNPKQFVAYRAIFLELDHAVKAKLVNDIDMTGIGMQPFGNNTKGTEDAGVNYKGVLDGQGHALENVYIKFLGGRGCALFYELDNATVKNLKLTGEYYGDMQRMGGLARYTTGAVKIENCEIAVVMHNEIEGDATTGGIMGVCRGGASVVVNNCLVNCTFIGDKAHSFGGVCGWKDGGANTLTLNNVLILNQYETAPEPSSYPSDVISRSGCTVNNVFYAERSLVPGASTRGTKATDAQLASGEICYKLNGENQGENAAWYQTLGEDATPVLDKTHKLVLYDTVLGYYNEGEDPDFIENITPSLPDTKGAIFNLAGQRVNKVQKGIYIVDGKKVLFK
ncbi:MAG: hypothetical protein J5524_09400 [Bacteroidaceae bacterium]|nr:hypothetical protein [Bacteroidaceae bacterium]MBO4841296.1 hypothetical protein [Bacteroidaceae bacterium]